MKEMVPVDSGRTMRAHPVLDYLKEKGLVRNDRDLARVLDVNPPHLSKIRNGYLKFGAGMILAVHEEFDIPIKEIKALLATMGE
jgi:transcriptional regulator with XRE-family HTH domain